MKTKKMSLANVQGKLSRNEMKHLMGGAEPGDSHCDDTRMSCSYYESGTGQVTGECVINSHTNCVCKGPNSSVIHADCNS